MVEVRYETIIGSAGIPINESQIETAIDAAREMKIPKIAIKELLDCGDGLNCVVSFPGLGEKVRSFEDFLWGLQIEYREGNTTCGVVCIPSHK